MLTYTDEKGEAHYFVESGTIADILDVCFGAEYHESINCVDFGGKPRLDSEGKVLLDRLGKPWWHAGDVRYDFQLVVRIDENGKKVGVASGTELDVGGGVSVLNGINTAPELTEEERAEKEKLWEEERLLTPVEPEYGVTGGMFTEVDPAEVNMASWSGTSIKGEVFRSAETIEKDFAFTPLLGEYAVITIENTGTEDAAIYMFRPYTVGNRIQEPFTKVRVPAGQTLVRAFRIDGELLMENRLVLRAGSFTDRPVQVALTAEQYRFGVEG